MTLTAEQLAEIIKQDGEAKTIALQRAKEWLPHILRTMTKCEINTPKRIAAFIAQIALESGGLKVVVENLNYSATGLANTWPHRYAIRGKDGKPIPGKPNELALRLHRKPKDIANNVYANRMGNGPEEWGWGWKFRGRGPKQVTGHDNYIACGKALGLPLQDCPELLEVPQHGMAAAGWFWTSNKLWVYADKGDFKGLTIALNGGLIGYDDKDRRDKDTRVDYYVVACRVLGVQ